MRPGSCRNTSLERNAPVEFGCARVGVIRHILRRFQRTSVLQKHGDARAAEGVIADALR